jgi:hypothetical protein
VVGFHAAVERTAEAGTLAPVHSPLATRGFGVPEMQDDLATRLREASAREVESVLCCPVCAGRADAEPVHASVLRRAAPDG